jgi:UDP-N-acetylglucosamine--N-acetylmuramyl-(pentapeptide) pyrophosphoryl-undecaprenol N-acetylglucosamine transferase
MNMVDLKDDMQAGHSAGKGRLRLCLAASGGGHIRQLLDLEEAWSPHHYVFVSEDTALSRSIVQRHPVHFLPHFAIGQIRRDGILRAIWSGLKNLWQSILLAIKLRPDVVVSTGAGSVFFFMVWCRLLGAKFILIETFARFDTPSTFARASALFASDIIVQSSALTKTFPAAAVFDPLKILDQPRPDKKRLLFATVSSPSRRSLTTRSNLMSGRPTSSSVMAAQGRSLLPCAKAAAPSSSPEGWKEANITTIINGKSPTPLLRAVS